MWHAAVLDTQMYAELQVKLRMTLHHRPSGASSKEEGARTMRRQTMTTLYRQFFQSDPIGAEWDDEEKSITTVDNGVVEEEEILMEKTESTDDTTTSIVDSVQTAVVTSGEQNQPIPVSADPTYTTTITTVNSMETPPSLFLTFRMPNGQEFYFRVKSNHPLRGLLKYVCRRIEMHRSKMRFMCPSIRGGVLTGDETPAELKMVNNDVIHGMLIQIGC